MRYDLNYFIRKPKCPRRSLSFTNSFKKRHENKITMELKDKVNPDLQAKRGSGHLSKRYISYFMCATCFWNNFHRICS